MDMLAAISLFTAAATAWPLAASAEPGLKPNQPNHSSAVPSATKGTLWGRLWWSFSCSGMSRRPPGHPPKAVLEEPFHTTVLDGFDAISLQNSCEDGSEISNPSKTMARKLAAPTTKRLASAPKPAVTCTTMPPAKSRAPQRARKPPPHSQWHQGQ